MAKPTTAPATAPTPTPAAAPAVPVTPPKPTKQGFDFWRPFRYIKGVVGGTLTHGLNGTANWGRKGAWIGAGVGVLAFMAFPPLGFLAMLVSGWAAGLVAGAVAGGTIGAVTGGIRGVGVEHRRDKYSDDLIAKARAKSQPQPKADYRDSYQQYQSRDAYNFDRLFQQEREIKHETNTYFQDHVRASRMGDHERGF